LGVQLRTAVVKKYPKVKYNPLKGGVLNFGTLRYTGLMAKASFIGNSI